MLSSTVRCSRTLSLLTLSIKAACGMRIARLRSSECCEQLPIAGSCRWVRMLAVHASDPQPSISVRTVSGSVGLTQLVSADKTRLFLPARLELRFSIRANDFQRQLCRMPRARRTRKRQSGQHRGRRESATSLRCPTGGHHFQRRTRNRDAGFSYSHSSSGGRDRELLAVSSGQRCGPDALGRRQPRARNLLWQG